MYRELSGIVLTPDWEGTRVEASPASLCCVLEQAHYPSLLLVQPRTSRSLITVILLVGRKESNQTNKCKLDFRVEE